MRRAIAIALLLVPSAVAAEGKAPRVATAERLEKLAFEVKEFRATTGELPGSKDGVESIASDAELLVDEWGNPIRYLRVAGGYWLLSWGADGAPGGEGDDADVVHIAIAQAK